MRKGTFCKVTRQSCLRCRPLRGTSSGSMYTSPSGCGVICQEVLCQRQKTQQEGSEKAPCVQVLYTAHETGQKYTEADNQRYSKLQEGHQIASPFSELLLNLNQARPRPVVPRVGQHREQDCQVTLQNLPFLIYKTGRVSVCLLGLTRRPSGEPLRAFSTSEDSVCWKAEKGSLTRGCPSAFQNSDSGKKCNHPKHSYQPSSPPRRREGHWKLCLLIAGHDFRGLAGSSVQRP